MNNSEKVNRDLKSNPEVDQELLKRIIEIQDLPEEVVIRFIKVAGSLSSANFRKRISDEQR
jgi:hypothetical protein